MTNKLAMRWVGALSLISVLGGAWASGVQNREPIVEAKLVTASVAPKAAVKATIKVTFAEGLHGYQNPPLSEFQIPLAIEMTSKVPGLTMKKIAYPKGMIRDVMGEKAALYEGSVAIPVEFVAPPKPGKYTVELSVNYQQCDENSCYPPGKKELKLTFTVAPPKKKG